MLGILAAHIGADGDDFETVRARILKHEIEQRPRDARDEEIDRLRAKVGEITMDNELLYEKISKMEAGRPFARRRSKR